MKTSISLWTTALEQLQRLDQEQSRGRVLETEVCQELKVHTEQEVCTVQYDPKIMGLLYLQ